MGHAFGWNTATMHPKRENRTSLRDPVLDYLLREYAEHPAFADAAIILNDMRNASIELTTQLVDYAISTSTRRGLERLKRKVEKQAQQEELASRASHVYFIKNGDRIKIGMSVDPKQRVRAISLSPDHLIATMPGGRTEEAELHQRFAQWRVPGTEWFYDNPELQDFIHSYAHPPCAKTESA